MNSRPRWPGSLIPGVWCLLLAGPLAVSAQERSQTDTVTWAVVNPKAGWCLNYLMEPDEAAKDLTRGYRVVAAREAQGLLPAVARLVRDEPTYADWIPSEVCIYLADAIAVEGRRFDRGDGGQQIAVLYWGVAATSADGGPLDQVSLRSFGSNSSRVQQNMGTRGIPIERIQLEVHPVPESSDREYRIKLSGAVIAYTGDPQPDSGAVAQERIRIGSMMGNNRAVWMVHMDWRPTAVGGMSGAIRVVGKKGLAKALNRSPIRVLSPSVLGGSGQVTFTR